MYSIINNEVTIKKNTILSIYIFQNALCTFSNYISIGRFFNIKKRQMSKSTTLDKEFLVRDMLRTLLYHGFGTQKNKLILRSFFRRRPYFLGKKIGIALQFIVRILLNNINFILLKLKSISILPLDKKNYFHDSLFSKTYNTITPVFLHSYLHCFTHIYFNSNKLSSITHLMMDFDNELNVFYKYTKYILKLLLLYKYNFIFKSLQLNLCKYFFFWKAGFGTIKSRIKRYTFLRSPHNDKRSRTQFYKKVCKAVLKVPVFLSDNQLALFKNFVGFEAYSSIELLSNTIY